MARVSLSFAVENSFGVFLRSLRGRRRVYVPFGGKYAEFTGREFVKLFNNSVWFDEYISENSSNISFVGVLPAVVPCRVPISKIARAWSKSGFVINSCGHGRYSVSCESGESSHLFTAAELKSVFRVGLPTEKNIQIALGIAFDDFCYIASASGGLDEFNTAEIFSSITNNYNHLEQVILFSALNKYIDSLLAVKKFPWKLSF